MSAAGAGIQARRPLLRLLFDQNLAPALAHRMADLYPGSAHVRDFGLSAAQDEAVWAHAQAHGFVIVTKDDEFPSAELCPGCTTQGGLGPARELPYG